MRRVLVLGCGGSAGINFIDSLRMAEEEMFIAGTDTNIWHLELPDVDAAYRVKPCREEGYYDQVNAIIEEHSIDVVHPQPDIEVEMLGLNRKRVKARTFLPSDRTIALCQDKMGLNSHLKRAGVAVPEALSLAEHTLQEAMSAIPGEKVWLRAVRGAGSRAALPVKRASHGDMWMDYWKEMRGLSREDFMVSEFLPGNEYAFQSLWKDGELVTSAARMRLEYIFGNLTPSGQSSSPSVAVTVHDERVNQLGYSAVKAVDPEATGIFCVDMKEDAQGVPKVTEINCGRFFTTSNFFAKLGANMPYTYIRMAMGEDPGEHPRFNAVPEGMYWIRLMDKGPVLSSGRWRAKNI